MKYLIHFMTVDTPSVEDDGVGAGTNFGIHPQAFNTKEEAEEYLEKEMIPQDQANLEECYGITEDPELAENYLFEVENGSYGRKELVVYDTATNNEINTTVYEIVGVKF